MSEKTVKVWLPKYLEGYPAEMFKYIKRRLGYEINRTVLVDLIHVRYRRLKEREMAKNE